MNVCPAVQVLVVESSELAPGTLTQVGAPLTPVCRTCPALPIPLPATTILLKVTLEMNVCPAVQVLVVESSELAPGTLTQVGAPLTPVCRTCPALPIPLPATTILLKVTLETNVCPAVQVLVVESSVLAPGTLTHVGAPPPFDCRTWPLEPNAPLNCKGPLILKLLTVPLLA